MACKVFNNQDEAWDQWKAQLLMAALRPPPPSSRWLDNNAHLQGSASSATRWDTWQKTALNLAHHQDPVHNVARVDIGGHWRTTAPLCLCKVGQAPTPTLNRVKPSWTSWAWWPKTDVAQGLGPLQDHFGGSQDNHPSTRWASITYQTSWVSFILHRSPWWGLTVSSTSQKRKDSFI
jgi:hypothetical protein